MSSHSHADGFLAGARDISPLKIGVMGVIVYAREARRSS